MAKGLGNIMKQAQQMQARSPEYSRNWNLKKLRQLPVVEWSLPELMGNSNCLN